MSDQCSRVHSSKYSCASKLLRYMPACCSRRITLFAAVNQLDFPMNMNGDEQSCSFSTHVPSNAFFAGCIYVQDPVLLKRFSFTSPINHSLAAQRVPGGVQSARTASSEATLTGATIKRDIDTRHSRVEAFAMFQNLPDGCIASVARQLDTARDLLNFARTCKRHANIALSDQYAWLGLLHQIFDFRLQVQYALSTGNT